MATTRPPASQTENDPLAKRLRQLLEERNMSRSELAEAIGTSRQNIGYYASGVSRPAYEMLAKIADYFGCSVDYLVRPEDTITELNDIDKIKANIEEESKRVQILREAESIICGERQDMYGSPEHSLATIAKYWSVYKGIEFTAMDAAMMLDLMKFARQQNKPKHDNLVDAIGYIACAAELEQ